MNTIIKKLSSRKFLVSLAGIVLCVIYAFTADAESMEKLLALVLSGLQAIAYTFVEGMVDKAAAPATVVVKGDEDEKPPETEANG